jgi:hypothetical protein
MYFQYSHVQRLDSVDLDIEHFSQPLQGLMQRSVATSRATSIESSIMSRGSVQPELFTVLGSTVGTIDQLGPPLGEGMFSRPEIMSWLRKVSAYQNYTEC